MRLLAIDIGNSRVKCAIFEDDIIVKSFSMDADKRASAAAFRHAFRAHVDDLIPQRAVVASVVRELNNTVSEAIEREFMILAEFMNAADLPPERVLYDPPDRLGADRIAAAVAAYHRFGNKEREPRPVVVVDAGTAVTFEFVSQDGVYEGGAIWAGPKLSAVGLNIGTSLLPTVDPILPSSAVGKNTEACLRSGILYGFLDGSAGIIRRFKQRGGAETFVVATGGYGKWLTERIDDIDEFDAHLVHHGIRLIATGSMN